MAVHKLALEKLEALDDGRVLAAFRAALKRAAQDCDDRPNDPAARIVTLQAELAPVLADGGMLDSVNVAFQVKDKLPTRKSKRYSMGYRKGGELVFNDLSEDNINQRTIDELDE